MTKQIWFPQLSPLTAEEAAVRKETKREKSGENEGRRSGEKKKNPTVVVGVSFDGAPLQHLHIFKSDDEYHAWGQTKTSQWEGCIPAAGSEAAAGIPAAPWERHREVVWEPRGPPS